MRVKPKKIIGRKEAIDLPEFGLFSVMAKVDTGAYTSAIHCSHIVLTKEEGREKINFHIPLFNNAESHIKVFQTDKFKLKNIKSSFGQIEKRYVIRTKIRVAGRLIISDFSLSDRTEMKHPILIGRKILKNKFLVDVSLAFTGMGMAFLPG